MHTQSGYRIIRYRWHIIIAATILFVLSALYGSRVIPQLSLARFEVKGSPSDLAAQALQQHFGVGHPNLLVLVTAKKGTVDDAPVRQAALQLVQELSQQAHVQEVTSYWQRAYAPALKSRDGRQALILAHVAGSVTAVRQQLSTLSPMLTRNNALIKTGVSGQDEVFRQVGAQSQRDFVLADAIAIPLVFLLLMIVFRSMLAALLTLMTSVFSIVVTLLVLRGLVQFTEVSTFALNLTMVLGLGIGVDYCLLVVSRFREEFGKTLDVQAAITITLETAGRTVLFSAVTVAVSLAALLLFPFFFLRSFAYAGIAVIGAGALAATIVLPAALAILKHRITPWGWWRICARKEGMGFWHSTAVMVMQRPLLIAVTVVGLLLLLGAPFLRIRFGAPDDRVLPPQASSRQVEEQLRQHFLAEEDDALRVVMTGISAAADTQAITDYAARLSLLEGVTQVDGPAGAYVQGRRAAPPGVWHQRFHNAAGAWLAVIPAQDRLEKDAFGLVREVRAVPAPFHTLVGGMPATFFDFQHELLAYIPLVAGVIVVVTFGLLFFMTGSLVLPLKAVVLNILSLSASFGALVWIFQEGHLSGWLQFTATGTMETSIPILMFCLAFGLSMDYEVFIMSRIREEYDSTGNNALAVARGLEKSASLVTTAAALLAIAFIAFSTSGITLMKMMGVGMTIAVLVDATIIRALLMPALMELMGNANWWPRKRQTHIHQTSNHSPH
ncbi:MMPL family transporter [Chitinophaga japonensis]|uniref:RND superfamily putative drug exporter n=1 Tax=Chitinophaga japonensis TaxID=104662 RepID=A0A562T3L4_CHIJA|nr:MMPL family transporter [Chitinophaga japonensis]TWI88155.1 RND superfamily putative drug exporter [Chitinophaga japonensis]